MKKIVLISKCVVGMQPLPMTGIDKSLNPFKKSKSKLLMDKLEEECKKKNIHCEFELNNQTITITEIINNNADLVLISPFIKSAILISLTEFEKQKCYFLTESEYVDLQVDNLINTISNL